MKKRPRFPACAVTSPEVLSSPDAFIFIYLAGGGLCFVVFFPPH